MIELTIALILEFIVIVALLVAFGWYVRESNKDKSKLINGILAKNSQEYVERTLADNTKIEPEVNKLPSDVMQYDQMDDEQFDQHIQATLGNETVDQQIV